MDYRLRHFLYRNRCWLIRLYRYLLLSGIIFVFFSLLYYLPVGKVFSEVDQSISKSFFDIAVSWGNREPHGLLRTSIPIMAWAGDPEDYPEEITVKSLIASVLAPFRINLNSFPELLAVEMPALSEYNKNRAVLTTSDRQLKPETLSKPMELSSEALVGIYFTHTGETYNPTDGTDRVAGKGGVVTTGEVIKEVLEKKHGIRVALDDYINDVDYGVSYVESEKTLRKMLDSNSKMQIVLDIHRDAGKDRENSLVNIEGKSVAPILIVVGSDARAPFPTWKKNYEYAIKLADKINLKYPGLCIGVRVKEGRYNQYLHPRALLLEMGSTSNTTDEASDSARMLAEVLADEVAQLAPEELAKKISVESDVGSALNEETTSDGAFDKLSPARRGNAFIEL